MKEALKNSGKILVPVLLALAFAVMPVACGNTDKGFSRAERIIIDKSGSVMYVAVMDRDSAVLRTPCRDLSQAELESPRLRVLMEKMLSTLTSPEQDGVGLAAPQVGIGRRLILVQRMDLEGKPFRFYLNPHLDSLWGEQTVGPEGCLSLPPLRGMVRRYSSVAVSYLEPETLEARTDTVHGYTAIIFQHECDHLDGVLYTDKADTVFVSESWAKEREAYSYDRPQWWPHPYQSE
jgi:peptide deformylase